MGSMFAGECSNCGHETLDLYLERGMDVCYAPAPCTNCRDVVEIDIMYPGKRHCPHCKAAVQLYNAPSLIGEKRSEAIIIGCELPDGRTFTMPDAKYFCPRCRHKDMLFEPTGFWD